MADNVTLPGTGIVVLADSLTDATLGTGVAQYLKIMDGTLNGTNKAAVTSGGALQVDGSLVTQPITQVDLMYSGSITVLNSNLNSGTATAGSTVATTQLASSCAVAIQVTGTWTGTMVPQMCVDGANWVTCSGLSLFNVGTLNVTGSLSGGFNGIWQANVSGAKYFRLTASAAMTGTAVVTMEVSTGGVGILINQPVGTQYANITQINGLSYNLGANTMANSIPVTISSNQTAVSTTVADLTASGSITILNANLSSGTATAGSTVATGQLASNSTVSIQVTGTWTGSMQPQLSVDGVNWVTYSGLSLFNVGTTNVTGTLSGGFNGVWQINVAGAKYFRMTATAAMTGTAVVTLQISTGGAGMLLQQSIGTQQANITQINGSSYSVGTHAMANSIPVTIASDQPSLPINVATIAASTVSTAGTGVQKVGITGSGAGVLDGTQGSASPANVLGTTLFPTSGAGGLTSYTLISAATTNAANVKSAAGTLYNVSAFNNGSTAAYLKIYNLSAAPTVGTSVALQSYLIPPNNSGVILNRGGLGIVMATGISISVQGGLATADTTAVLLAQVVVNLEYK